MNDDVAKMIANPWIYIIAATDHPLESYRVVIYSVGGVLRAMSVDQVLSPEGFNPAVRILHGPLK